MDASVQLLKDENIRQEGNHYKCLTCQKNLESLQVLKDHIEGKAHRRKSNNDSTRPYYCDPCKKDFNSQQQYDEHVKGRSHKKCTEQSSMLQHFKTLSLNDTNDFKNTSTQQNEAATRMHFSYFSDISGNNSNLQMKYIKEQKLIGGKMTCFICDLCSKFFSNYKEAKKHAEGKEHSQKMARERAPDRQLPALFVPSCQNIQSDNLTEFKPRDYQIEIFNKTVKKDSVIFLPTGTGKTLCAAMVISQLLKLNPKRSVLFLVDKVLLAFQQKTFLEHQLCNILFDRYDYSEHKMVRRKIEIAVVCGGNQCAPQMHYWMYDIIVCTAEYCANLMKGKTLKWSDFSCVVIDEVHHCFKNHPYKKIVEKEHLILEKGARPQILGMTASPAASSNIHTTVEMLEELCDHLGGAQISIVEKSIADLNMYRSNATLEIEMLPPTEDDILFNTALQSYLKECLIKLDEIWKFLGFLELVTEVGKKTSVTKLQPEQLAPKVLLSLEKILNEFSDNFKSESLLFNHTMKILTTLSISLELGIPLVREDLEDLLEVENPEGLYMASILGLPCKYLMELCQMYLDKMKDESFYQKTDGIMSTIGFLIGKLTSPKIIDWKPNKDGHMPMILILVKERISCKRLCDILKKCLAFKEYDLSVVSLMGHGIGGGPGMKIKAQENTLKELKDGKHQVIIGTSVVEEGIDLPECQLVISMKPPNNVTALLQTRGRARVRNGVFLIVCEKEEDKDKINVLLYQENIMEKATQEVVRKYKTFS